MKKNSLTDFSSRSKPLFGNRRSKALNATKRQFRLNLQVFRFIDATGKRHKVYLPVRELRKFKAQIIAKKKVESKPPVVVDSPTIPKPSFAPVTKTAVRSTKKTSSITKSVKKTTQTIKKSTSKIVKSPTKTKLKTPTESKTSKVSKPATTKRLKKITDKI